MAWSNFVGGSAADSECLPNIPPGGISFSGANAFYCNSGGYTVNVVFNGGVLPVVWATNLGQITTTGPRTAQVKIHSAVSSPLVFTGYAGHITSPNTPTCNDTTFGYAYARLGKQLLDKGIFSECRHHCDFTGWNCHGQPVGTIDATCGDNVFIIEPNDCPYSELTSAGSSYGTPGDCMGGCRNADQVDFSSYPDIWYFVNVNPSSAPGDDYADCGHGKPFSTVTPANSLMVSWYGGSGSAIFDTRHPNLIAAGCSPCALVQDTDLVITVVDAIDNVVIQDIHIN